MQDQTQIEKLTKDLRDSARLMTRDQARYLVDTYYQMQEFRIAQAGQVRALQESGEPYELTEWFSRQTFTLETRVKQALDQWSKSRFIGSWARQHKGVGPVIAAGLDAHIDIEKAQTYGAIWRFAGLDPSAKWEKGQIRPWNADLKVLCAFKLGESLVKVSNKEDAYFGQLYKRKKLEYQERNEAGGYAETAERILSGKRAPGKSTEAFGHLSQGKLPPSQIHARARRVAVKVFLSCWHEEAYVDRFGVLPPAPYPIEHLGHAHNVWPPHMSDKVRKLRHDRGDI